MVAQPRDHRGGTAGGGHGDDADQLEVGGPGPGEKQNNRTA